MIIKADGSKVTVNIGEAEGDPVFCVTDLLPHLATEQMKRPSVGLIRGEELNVLVGSMPFKKSEESEAVKLNLLHILYEKYGITESDFVSAELKPFRHSQSRKLALTAARLADMDMMTEFVLIRLCGHCWILPAPRNTLPL